MKRILFTLVSLFFCLGVHAQSDLLASAKKMKPTGEYDNIHVQRLFGDARSTAFVIWIKDKVRPHKHAVHSETVYILDGKGDMTLGEEHFEVRKGDVVFIPEGRPHSVVTTGGVLKVLSVQAPEFTGKDRIFLDEQ